jgi:hypothetical protein
MRRIGGLKHEQRVIGFAVIHSTPLRAFIKQCAIDDQAQEIVEIVGGAEVIDGIRAFNLRV